MSASSMRAVQAVKAGGAFVLTSLSVPDPGPDKSVCLWCVWRRECRTARTARRATAACTWS